ncbi:MAG: NUDIX domain-containing protein, partial [Oceanicaulis sp.]
MSGPGAVILGVGLVVWRGEDVLLIRRGKPPFEGRWSIPGGRVEPGESLEAAALLVREGLLDAQD